MSVRAFVISANPWSRYFIRFGIWLSALIRCAIGHNVNKWHTADNEKSLHLLAVALDTSKLSCLLTLGFIQWWVMVCFCFFLVDDIKSVLWQISVSWCDSLDLFRIYSVLCSYLCHPSQIFLPLPPSLLSNISSFSPCLSLFIYLTHLSFAHSRHIKLSPRSPTSCTTVIHKHQVNSPLPNNHSFYLPSCSFQLPLFLWLLLLVSHSFQLAL